jgi:hypothetical protein
MLLQVVPPVRPCHGMHCISAISGLRGGPNGCGDMDMHQVGDMIDACTVAHTYRSQLCENMYCVHV